MNNVVLITGSSSGIGLETAKLFQAKSWNVAATMRSPEKNNELKNIVDLAVIKLDVTDAVSIRSAIDETIEKFGRIDAVVNNAGFSVTGPFEAIPEEDVRRQFETNVFGLMNVCREILPYFRERKRGTIVNIASVGGRVTFPFYSLYNSTKWAVEGFSESLQFELKEFGIKIKIIEPGPIKTEFYGSSQTRVSRPDLSEYDHTSRLAFRSMDKAAEDAPDGRIVAETIFKAVTDGTWQLRYQVNTKGLLAARKLLPDSIFLPIVRKALIR